MPANAVGMTFGLGLIANGTLTTDDYSLVDPGTGATAPATSASTPSTLASIAGQASPAPMRPSTPGPKVVKTHAHASNLIPGQARGHTSAQPGQKFAVPEIDATGRKTQG